MAIYKNDILYKIIIMMFIKSTDPEINQNVLDIISNMARNIQLINLNEHFSKDKGDTTL